MGCPFYENCAGGPECAARIAEALHEIADWPVAQQHIDKRCGNDVGRGSQVSPFGQARHRKPMHPISRAGAAVARGEAHGSSSL
jgi:hypothetical protein